MSKAMYERNCVHFISHGPLGLGTCRLTGYCFSGKLEVSQCAKFVKKERVKSRKEASPCPE